MGNFGDTIQTALKESGINKDELPEIDRTAGHVIEFDSLEDLLKEHLLNTLERLADLKLRMPLIHFTTSAVTNKDGNAINTGFIENIQSQGLNVRTNVAGFVKRSIDHETGIASPAYFLREPVEFFDDLQMIMQRYIHHGTRTNKTQLMSLRNDTHQQGRPVMVLIHNEDFRLVRGIDGDDHFVIQQRVSPANIMGIINLEGIDSEDPEDVIEVVGNIVICIDEFLESKF